MGPGVKLNVAKLNELIQGNRILQLQSRIKSMLGPAFDPVL